MCRSYFLYVYRQTYEWNSLKFHTVVTRKLGFFVHIMRKPGDCLEKPLKVPCWKWAPCRKTTYNLTGHHQDVDTAIVAGSSEGKSRTGKDYTIGTLHYNWISHAHVYACVTGLQHVQCTDSVIMPGRVRVSASVYAVWCKNRGHPCRIIVRF